MKNTLSTLTPIKILLLLLFLLSVSCQSTQYDRNSSANYLRVKRVVDGDTFWVYNDSMKAIKVRLIGVDTPETVHPRKSGEYFGEEASDYVKSLLETNRVRLEYDVGKEDRYGRTLAYVYLEDGTFLNADLLKKGYARIMTIPPNIKHADYFLKLERKARKKKKGMWKKKIE